MHKVNSIHTIYTQLHNFTYLQGLLQWSKCCDDAHDDYDNNEGDLYSKPIQTKSNVQISAHREMLKYFYKIITYHATGLRIVLQKG